MSTPESAPHETPEFSITRTFDAPRDLVWRAWTVESELAQWLRPFGVSTDSVSFDVQVGGRYRYTMTNAETGEVFPTGGEFLEVTPQDRLVFTWGEPDIPVDIAPVITLTFTPLGPIDSAGNAAHRARAAPCRDRGPARGRLRPRRLGGSTRQPQRAPGRQLERS